MIDADSPIDREYINTYSKYNSEPTRSTTPGASGNKSNQISQSTLGANL